MLAAWPPRAFDLYGPAIAKMRKMAQEPNGIPADEVAKVVARLLRGKASRDAVLVGSDARLLALIERLPTRTRDWLIALQLPKYG